MRKFLVPLLVAALLMALSPVSASAYVWLIEDSSKQTSLWSGYENYVNYWLVHDYTALFWAESSVASYARQAANNWKTKIPEISLLETSLQYAADVVVRKGNGPCDVDALGCHTVTEVYADSDRNANYTLASALYIDLDDIAAGGYSGYETFVAAHEFGHFYGLHEQYGPGGTCNSVSTVMDAVSCEPKSVQGPTTTDVSRVDAFYGDGSASNVKFQVYSGSHVEISWKDNSGGERHYIVEFYDYITKALLASRTESGGIGLKAGLSWVPDRTIRTTWVPPRTGTFYACVTPYFASWGQRGDSSCSTAWSWTN